MKQLNETLEIMLLRARMGPEIVIFRSPERHYESCSLSPIPDLFLIPPLNPDIIPRLPDLPRSNMPQVLPNILKSFFDYTSFVLHIQLVNLPSISDLEKSVLISSIKSPKIALQR